MNWKTATQAEASAEAKIRELVMLVAGNGLSIDDLAYIEGELVTLQGQVSDKRKALEETQRIERLKE